MELSVHWYSVRPPPPRSALYNWYFIKGEQFENMFHPRVITLYMLESNKSEDGPMLNICYY